jgi:type III secretion protein I
MTDIAVIASMTPTSAAPAVSSLPRASADDLAAARFAEIMGAQQSPELVPSQDATVAASEGTVGERILAGAQGLSSELQSTYRAITAALEGELTMAQGLKLQLKIGEIGLAYEMLGKTVQRSTQNLDTLVKVQ